MTDTESAETHESAMQTLRVHPIRRLSYYEDILDLNIEFVDANAANMDDTDVDTTINSQNAEIDLDSRGNFISRHANSCDDN